MANILEVAFEVAAEIKFADKEIDATPIGDDVTIEIPPIDAGFVRLKGNKKVKIKGLILERTQ